MGTVGAVTFVVAFNESDHGAAGIWGDRRRSVPAWIALPIGVDAYPI
jgi:hypothetical protein